MNRELLSKAVGDLDERFVAEAWRPVTGEKPGAPERIVQMRSKRMVTLALAAALILSLSAAACAVWSVHAARQQELREELKIDGAGAAGYVEYPVPEERQSGVVLLSALNDGEEERIYVNVSPVSEEELGHFPEEARFFWDVEGAELQGFAAPQLPPELSLSGGDEIRDAVKEYAYDGETQTLTLQCYLNADACRRTMEELGTEALPLRVNMAVGDDEPRCFGVISVSLTEERRRVFDFGPARYHDEELGLDAEIIGLELTPFSAVWRLSYPEAAAYHSPGADGEQYRGCGVLEDKICIDARIRFSDGSAFSTGGPLTCPYEDGEVRLYCGWGGAVNVDEVQSITLGDLVLWERD